MNLLVLGLNHKTAGVEIRERLAFSGDKLSIGLQKIKGLGHVKEVAILSTCNRVEVFVVTQQEGVFEDIKVQLSEIHGIETQLFSPHLYLYSGYEGVRHVFRVASSLDSMVVGEPQILGQLKEAYSFAQRQGTTGPVLNRLFSHAISTSKRVRTETRIAENAVSISYAAVELAKRIFTSLQGKRFMLIGAGEMAELAARHLINNGARDVVVANRTYQRACELATDFCGRAVDFKDFFSELVHIDIVICSTAASEYVIKKDQMQRLMRDRRNRPVFIIDISVPRNVDPAVNDIDNVYLYDVDDLQGVVDANKSGRAKEAEKAEGIVIEEVDRFISWLDSLQVVPTIVALRQKAEAIRDEEFKKFRNRFSNIGDEELKAVHYMGTAIINKLIHPSMVALKESGAEQTELVAMVKRLYNL
jgi:glutamyl-tRNA reductase